MRYHISVKFLFSKIPLGNFLDILRMRNVKKRFGDKEILKGLQLSVPGHSIYGFVGKNGIQTVPKERRHRISAGRSGILFLYDSFRIPFLLRRNHRLFEAFAESFAENGINYREITVDAMTSWAQFYKYAHSAFVHYFCRSWYFTVSKKADIIKNGSKIFSSAAISCYSLI